MANGVPVVLPEHGCFPELVADTGGGLLHQPHDSADLASKLRHLLTNPREATQLGQRGHETVSSRYTAEKMAQQTAELYASQV